VRRSHQLCAGPQLDDDANVLLRFKGGAKGVLQASQICIGDENDLNIRVYGAKASLEWRQEHPNELIVKYPISPPIYRRGNPYLCAEASYSPGFPAAIPRATSRRSAIFTARLFAPSPPRCRAGHCPRSPISLPLTTGVTGMAFIETVVKSSRLGAKWVKFPDV